MKKSLLILPLAAALALSSCSKDEPFDKEGVASGNDGQFLAVSIVPNTDGGTRYEDATGAKFEDGSKTENEVKGVRIYFFNTSGDAVSIKKNSSANYYDIPSEVINEAGFGGPNHSQTVEKTINAVVIVESGEKLPAQIVAIVNPHIADLGTGSISWPALKDKVDNFAQLANSQDSLFVMVNSVFADGNSIVATTTVTPSNYAKTKELALQNPVEIFVERNVAKVRVAAAESMQRITDNNMFPVYRKVDGAEVPYKIGKENEEKEVYVKFGGWDVTATLPYAYISKHIIASWPATKLGPNTTWNAPDYHRSYWADVCNGGTGRSNNNQYFSFADDTKFKATKFDGKEYVYCNENAERTGEYGIQATKVLIKGQLCDGTGAPLTLTEYAGNRIIDDTEFSGLKARYLLMLKGNRAQMPWKAIKNDDNTTSYKEISAEDIAFITATQANGLNEDKSGTYYVYPCLTDEAKTYTWYSKVTENGTNVTVDPADIITDLSTIDADLKDLSRAKIWNTGWTYYYADIQHIGTSVGVVRNHIYDINLTKIYGLGTPVYDPDEVIIPEKPQNEDTFVAAEINILSWRVVNSDVELDWND